MAYAQPGSEVEAVLASPHGWFLNNEVDVSHRTTFASERESDQAVRLYANTSSKVKCELIGLGWAHGISRTGARAGGSSVLGKSTLRPLGRGACAVGLLLAAQAGGSR